MILQKCYYVFNEQIELYPASYGLLSLKAKMFNASGGQDVTYLYAYNGTLRWDIGDTTSGLMYNASNTSFAKFGWQFTNYRFLEITEESEISEDFYNWLLENGTFIDSSVYIKSGNYNFNNRSSYSSYTANTFIQVVNFVVGNTLGCYAISVAQFSVGYNTSEGGVNYVYPFNTGNYNSNYYLLTFNEDTFITKECAIWFIYMCINNGIATKPSDVVYKQIIPTGYSITFESNGGSSIPTQNNVTNITNLPTPTRRGYTFNGWYYDSLFISRAKVGDTLTSNVTLYASWSLITYRVDYVTNPSIATAPQSISGVTELPTPLPIPSIIEFQYTFIGWYYDSQYLTQAFAGDALNSNVTLYGKFEIGTYDVDFVTNGGTAVSSITGVSNLPSPLPTTYRDGYDFLGWYYDADFNTVAFAGDLIYSNVNLYAKWERVYDNDNLVLECYKFSGEHIMVDKRNYMTHISTFRGTARDAIDVIAPTLEIELKTFPNFNYVYIPTFKRYYYVSNIVCARRNIYEITLSVDVLMSYASGLLQLNAFIDRNEYEYDSEIVDKQMVIEQGVNIQIRRKSTPLFRNYSSVAIVGTDLGGLPV